VEQVDVAAVKRRWWNPYVMIDRGVLALGTWLGPSKLYFEDIADSESFEEHLAGVELDVPAWSPTDRKVVEVPAQTLTGPLDPAFCVMHWVGPDTPTVLYVHAAAMVPFDRNIRRIFPYKSASPCNVVAVRMPCHQSTQAFVEGTADMRRYVALMATTAALVEHLLTESTLRDVPFTLAVGSSLGGIILNRHHLLLNSAAAYLPIVAGTCHGRILLEAVPQLVAPCDPAVVAQTFDFDEAWRAVGADYHRNVFPMLAEYDSINQLETQGPSYGGIPCDVWQTGHLTTFLSTGRLRELISSRLPGPT